MTRDVLFLLQAPFEDAALSGAWYCAHCASLEGALLANPHWAQEVEVRRLPFPRPRHDIVGLLGEGHQSMPVLVLADAASAPAEAKRAEGRAYLNDPWAIGRHLAARYGGAAPHP
jgi:hypothetical protein